MFRRLKDFFKKEEPRLILNQIKTPDGTILTSYSIHDYKTYIDKNGEEYMVDGGNAYLRRNANIKPFEEQSVWSDAPFQTIRESFHWGTYGKTGRDPLKWVVLSYMSNKHLEAIIKNYPNNRNVKIFKKELKFRKKRKIYVED